MLHLIFLLTSYLTSAVAFTGVALHYCRSQQLTFQQHEQTSCSTSLSPHRVRKTKTPCAPSSLAMKSTEFAPSGLEADVSNEESDNVFSPLFEFSTKGNDTIAKFERIDDVIVGGVSTSRLIHVPSQPPSQDQEKDEGEPSYASWNGICRIDGGGFCGFRTLPFKQPLMIDPNMEGIFVKCRLASDNEPERRVWKMTLRTEKTRSEILYQAPLTLTKDQAQNGTDWTMVKVPFSSFQKVRGPRLIPNVRGVDIKTDALYQIGMSLSKFVMAEETTELPNFRPGYFDLHIQTIGVYGKNTASVTDMSEAREPKIMSLEEQSKQKPIPLRMLSTLAKALFSEQAKRRKVATNIYKDKRGLNRLQSISMATKYYARSHGWPKALARTALLVGSDAGRWVVFQGLKVGVLFPLLAVGKMVSFFKKRVLGVEVKEMPKLE